MNHATDIAVQAGVSQDSGKTPIAALLRLLRLPSLWVRTSLPWLFGQDAGWDNVIAELGAHARQLRKSDPAAPPEAGAATETATP